MASKVVAEQGMQDAAKEICTKYGDENAAADTGVTNDGALQWRGHASMIGFVVRISVETGKILDARKCKSCEQYEIFVYLLHFVSYDPWKASHHWGCNYAGTAPNMEAVGTLNIFHRSVVKNKLRYTDLYGDVHSKSHKVIKDVYPGIKVVLQTMEHGKEEATHQWIG